MVVILRGLWFFRVFVGVCGFLRSNIWFLHPKSTVSRGRLNGLILLLVFGLVVITYLADLIGKCDKSSV